MDGAGSVPRKRFKFLWQTYTVRGNEMSYVQVDSAFGTRTSFSWGRWVLSNVVLIFFLAVASIVFLSVWVSTGAGVALGGALLFALLDLPYIALFAWSMTPARATRR